GGGWEGMIAEIRRSVTCAARSLKRRNAPRTKPASRQIVVYTSDIANVDTSRIENGLSACDRCPWVLGRQRSPGIESVENRGTEPAVARGYKAARLLELGEHKMDAGIYTDEEGLIEERSRPTACPVLV